jgi:hypothetical protein
MTPAPPNPSTGPCLYTEVVGDSNCSLLPTRQIRYLAEQVPNDGVLPNEIFSGMAGMIYNTSAQAWRRWSGVTGCAPIGDGRVDPAFPKSGPGPGSPRAASRSPPGMRSLSGDRGKAHGLSAYQPTRIGDPVSKAACLISGENPHLQPGKYCVHLRWSHINSSQTRKADGQSKRISYIVSNNTAVKHHTTCQTSRKGT